MSVMPKFAGPRAKIFSFSRKVEAPYIELQGKTITKDVLALLPEQVARHYEVAPIEIKGDTLILAMIDPEDQEILELVKKKTGLKIERRLCTLDDLNHVLDQYSGLQTEVEEIVKEKTAEGKPKEEEKKAKEAATEIEISEEAPAAKIASVAAANAAGFRIGGVANTATFRTSNKTAPNATHVSFEKADTAVAALRDGAVDALAFSRESLTGIQPKVPGSRILDGGFLNSTTSVAVPKGKPAALAYVTAFIEEAKAAGLVRQAFDEMGLKSSQVAPAGMQS